MPMQYLQIFYNQLILQPMDQDLLVGRVEFRQQIKEILRAIENVEINQCFERLFCDIASGENDFETLSPILNVLSSNEDIASPYRKKYLQLKKAEQLGAHFQSIRICEISFRCPTTGVDIMNNTMRFLTTQNDQ